MLRDLDCIWAGLNRDCKSSEGLFTDLWNSKIARGLMNLGLSPAQIAQMSTQELIRLIKAQSIKGIGPDWARKIIKHAASVLPCDEKTADIHLQVMKTNLKMLEDLDNLIKELDRKTAIVPRQNKKLVETSSRRSFWDNPGFVWGYMGYHGMGWGVKGFVQKNCKNLWKIN